MKLPKSLPRLKKPELFMLRRVVGNSMRPALKPNKIIIAFKTRNIEPGDIVIIRHEGLEKTKRVKFINNGLVFVVGDNQAHSTDSRSFGWLPISAIIAKVWR